MVKSREVVLEMAVAALLKAAGHHKDDLIQRANGLLLGGELDEIGGGAENKSAACTAIADLAERI